MLCLRGLGWGGAVGVLATLRYTKSQVGFKVNFHQARLWSVQKTCHFFSAPVKFWTSVTGWMAASPTGIDVRIRWPSAEIS